MTLNLLNNLLIFLIYYFKSLFIFINCIFHVFTFLYVSVLILILIIFLIYFFLFPLPASQQLNAAAWQG